MPAGVGLHPALPSRRKMAELCHCEQPVHSPPCFTLEIFCYFVNIHVITLPGIELCSTVDETAGKHDSCPTPPLLSVEERSEDICSSIYAGNFPGTHRCSHVSLRCTPILCSPRYLPTCSAPPSLPALLFAFCCS